MAGTWPVLSHIRDKVFHCIKAQVNILWGRQQTQSILHVKESLMEVSLIA